MLKEEVVSFRLVSQLKKSVSRLDFLRITSLSDADVEGTKQWFELIFPILWGKGKRW